MTERERERVKGREKRFPTRLATTPIIYAASSCGNKFTRAMYVYFLGGWVDASNRDRHRRDPEPHLPSIHAGLSGISGLTEHNVKWPQILHTVVVFSKMVVPLRVLHKWWCSRRWCARSIRHGRGQRSWSSRLPRTGHTQIRSTRPWTRCRGSHCCTS